MRYIIAQKIRVDNKMTKLKLVFIKKKMGVQMIISIKTHMTCDFPGGPDPLFTSLDSHMKGVFLSLKLIFKYNIGLKTLLQQGISEPIFYGDCGLENGLVPDAYL